MADIYPGAACHFFHHFWAIRLCANRFTSHYTEPHLLFVGDPSIPGLARFHFPRYVIIPDLLTCHRYCLAGVGRLMADLYLGRRMSFLPPLLGHPALCQPIYISLHGTTSIVCRYVIIPDLLPRRRYRLARVGRLMADIYLVRRMLFLPLLLGHPALCQPIYIPVHGTASIVCR
ncbi:hypothetical protein J6590_036369 [Homalodisca vitripennis]|nr:hypothetical protein J6590_036369 [Homalodisca vitripennis]